MKLFRDRKILWMIPIELQLKNMSDFAQIVWIMNAFDAKLTLSRQRFVFSGCDNNYSALQDIPLMHQGIILCTGEHLLWILIMATDSLIKSSALKDFSKIGLWNTTKIENKNKIHTEWRHILQLNSN